MLRVSQRRWRRLNIGAAAGAAGCRRTKAVCASDCSNGSRGKPGRPEMPLVPRESDLGGLECHRPCLLPREV